MGEMWVPAVCLPLVFLWLVTCIAETNRTPFDFAEGESELVSGFNVEYGAGGFALIFMAEYGRIILLALISAILILGRSVQDTPILLTIVRISFF